MPRARRRKNAVEASVTSKVPCTARRDTGTLPQPIPGTDDMMRSLFGGPPKAARAHDSKETK